MADSWRQVISATIGTHKATNALLRVQGDDANRGGKYIPPKNASALPQDPRPTPVNHMTVSSMGLNGPPPGARIPQHSQLGTSSQYQPNQWQQSPSQQGYPSPSNQYAFNTTSAYNWSDQQNHQQLGTFPSGQSNYGSPSSFSAHNQPSQHPSCHPNYPYRPPSPQYPQPQRNLSFPRVNTQDREPLPPLGIFHTGSVPVTGIFSPPQPLECPHCRTACDAYGSRRCSCL